MSEGIDLIQEKVNNWSDHGMRSKIIEVFHDDGWDKINQNRNSLDSQYIEMTEFVKTIDSNHKRYHNSLIDHDSIEYTSYYDSEAPITFSKDITTLKSTPTKVELLLIKNEILYIWNDGKLYFTHKAIKYAVTNWLVSIGAPTEILGPSINLFGMPCIDGRYKLPDDFTTLPLEEKLKINTGAIPWGGAGMLMTIIASLRKIFDEEDPHYLDYIREIVFMLLEKNKANNPENYKVQWHDDLHPKNIEGFVCGCGFLCNAKENPELYGMNHEMMNFVIEILHSKEWSAKPVILWKGNRYLEQHKERVAFVLNNIDANSRYENFVMLKQINFKDFLTKEEFESLDTDQQEELNQMFFTANFRSFPVLISEAASTIIEYLVQDSNLIEKVVLSDKDKIELARRHNSYFDIEKNRVTSWDAVLALLKNNIKEDIKEATGHIKQKLSWAPLVTIDVTKDDMYEISATFKN